MNRRNSSYPPVSYRTARAILRRLRRIGLHLNPFFTVREGELAQSEPVASNEFQFGFVRDDQFDALAEIEQSEDRQTLRSWLKEGKRCFAAWDGPRLIAKTWCDVAEFSFAPNYRRLDDDEAYLFAAYAHPDYRGRNLAPQMRYQCYQALRGMGRTRFYSYTEFFNIPARRFKDKLGARNESLRLYVCLLGRWSHTFTLRNYL